MSAETRAVRAGWFAANTYHDFKSRREELTLGEVDAMADCKVCPVDPLHLRDLWYEGWDGAEAGFTLEETLAANDEKNPRLFVRED